MTDIPREPVQSADPAAGDPAFADLCHVQRNGDRVLMSFGRHVPAQLPDGSEGAEGVQLQHQIGLAAAGAAQLQDLLLALLQATPASTGNQR